MYIANEMETMETVGRCVCKPKEQTIAEKARETGEMLEESRQIMSRLGVVLFGDCPIEGERPLAKCFEDEMEMNLMGAKSLLDGLRYIHDRLF